MKRLEMYSNKLVDYHLIMDMLPQLARIYFCGKMPDVKLSLVQQVCVVVVLCDFALHVYNILLVHICSQPLSGMHTAVGVWILKLRV